MEVFARLSEGFVCSSQLTQEVDLEMPSLMMALITLQAMIHQMQRLVVALGGGSDAGQLEIGTIHPGCRPGGSVKGLIGLLLPLKKSEVHSPVIKRLGIVGIAVTLG